MKYSVGDIVYIRQFIYPDGKAGTNHYFVVFEVRDEEIEVIEWDYMGMLISSKIHKNNDVNHKYSYNEPLKKGAPGNLKKDGHIKADYLFPVREEQIDDKIGTITTDQYLRLLELNLKAGE